VVESKQLEIEHACTRLIFLYAHAIDSGDIELALGCYTEDAKRSIGRRTAQGRDKIREMLQASLTGKVTCHVITNLVIDVLSDTRAMATSYLTLWRAPGYLTDRRPALRRSPTAVSRQRDDLVLAATGWKFRARHSDTLFTAATEGGGPGSDPGMPR
jgi:hypothetical protein